MAGVPAIRKRDLIQKELFPANANAPFRFTSPRKSNVNFCVTKRKREFLFSERGKKNGKEKIYSTKK